MGGTQLMAGLDGPRGLHPQAWCWVAMPGSCGLAGPLHLHVVSGPLPVSLQQGRWPSYSRTKCSRVQGLRWNLQGFLGPCPKVPERHFHHFLLVE